MGRRRMLIVSGGLDHVLGGIRRRPLTVVGASLVNFCRVRFGRSCKPQQLVNSKPLVIVP